MDDLLNDDRRNIWHPFTSLAAAAETPLITSADGVYLHTADGRKIIDAISSWWVNLHGHSHPHIADAIARQAKSLEHVIFAGFTHEPAIRLSKNLLTLLPGGYSKVFFSDNGSTAVEVAMKMAIQYWHNQGHQRRKIIAIKGAYHGDTFGAMSVAERGLFTKAFDPYLFETIFIDFPNDENAEQVTRQFKALVEKNDIAAFIFEPLVQAAGGMRMYSPAILEGLVEVAREHEVLCIADEVFTGFGRTGKYLAVDYLRNKPDIIALSKGITGGFLPLGVTACSERIVEAFDSPELSHTFFHGHSYTANPIACAAANASFELLTAPACLERIRDIEGHHQKFASQIATSPAVLDARCLGTILAVEVKSEAAGGYENPLRKKIYPWFLERNILLRPLGNVIYIVPPYVITAAQLNTVYGAIEEFLSSLERK